jgi:hypothetical protein
LPHAFDGNTRSDVLKLIDPTERLVVRCEAPLNDSPWLVVFEREQHLPGSHRVALLNLNGRDSSRHLGADRDPGEGLDAASCHDTLHHRSALGPDGLDLLTAELVNGEAGNKQHYG